MYVSLTNRKTFFKLPICKRVLVCLIVSIGLFNCDLYAQNFTEIPTQILGLNVSSAAWGDFDNDLDLDLVVVGDSSTELQYIARIYRNDEGSFVNIDAPIVQAGSGGSVEWGDYDNDGDLDLLLTGRISATEDITKIYQNENGSFSDIGGSFRAMERGTASWGDYDNDGDLDFVICGVSLGFGIYSRLYENVGQNTFNEKDVGLSPIFLGQIGWVDYDLDGDLDIFLSGEDDSGQRVSKLYRNDDSLFFDTGINIQGLSFSFFSWGDIDHDQDPDLLLGGSISGFDYYTRVLLNTNGTFINGPILEELASGQGAWGDLNNDQWIDLAISGYKEDRTGFASVYQNDGAGDLIGTNPDLSQIFGVTIVGDYDNDKDLDLALAGSGQLKLYRNDIMNTAPDPQVPENLTASVDKDGATLSWLPAPSAQLNFSFNVRIGTSPGGGNVLSGMSDSSGYRLIPQPGNAGYATSFVIKNLPQGKYYWSVQSIDANYIGSPFADIDSFLIQFDPNNLPPVVENIIPNQALVINRDIFERNLLSNPTIFRDPNGDPLYFMASSSDTTVAVAQVSGSVLHVTPKDTGEAVISVFVTDSLAGTNESSFKVFVIPLPNKTTFVEQSAGLPTLPEGENAWGDFDGDEDLDLVITGIDYSTYEPFTKVFRNDHNDFVDINANLIGVYMSDAKWGDFDNDNDLDLIVSGLIMPNDTTILYRNDDGVFVDAGAFLQDVCESALAWGDYDNDGDLDLLLTGIQSYVGGVTKLYQNNAGSFTEITTSLPGVRAGSVNWGDYDNDNDLDILISGASATGNLTRLLRNDNQTFTVTPEEFAQVSHSSSAFGDYDNDGDLDILISGLTDDGPVTKIYRNELGEFVDILANIKYVRNGSVEWGDYDNDGDFDIIVTGYNETDSTYVAIVYENYQGCFVDTEIPIWGADVSSCEWGDYDNDGDLDFILSGLNYFIGPITFIYQNQIANQTFQNKLSTPNNKPTSPTNLQTMVDGTDLTFSWDKAKDSETEQDALTYNIRVGTTLDGNELMPSMSKPQTGYRFKPELGNVNHNTIWRLRNVPNSIIFWTVQAIDNAYAGSEFAPVQQIITGVRLDTSSIINNYSLSQNYPNPFNPVTMINYQLPITSAVELSIYNLLGQKVATLVNERKRAGYHQVEWNASGFASGIYLYRLEAEWYVETKKMVLMR